MPPPPPPPPPPNSASNAGTFIAAMMVLACALGFFLLVVIVNPFIVGVLVIPLVFGPLAFVQYLVWGRWLARWQVEDQEREALHARRVDKWEQRHRLRDEKHEPEAEDRTSPSH